MLQKRERVEREEVEKLEKRERGMERKTKRLDWRKGRGRRDEGRGNGEKR